MGDQAYGPFGMPGHGTLSEADILVPAGTTIIARVTFDPTVHGLSGVGLNNRSVFIETDNGTKGQLELSFKTTVVK